MTPNVIIIDHPVIQTKLAELRDYCDVHAFADGCRHVDPALGPARAPDGVEVLPARFLGEHYLLWQPRGEHRLRQGRE